MNVRVYILLIFAFISIIPGANEIEIGLIQECGGLRTSYVYNPASIVLCSSPTDCVEGGYWCGAIGANVSCGITIYATAPPGTVLCRDTEGVCMDPDLYSEWPYYWCNATGSEIPCGQTIYYPDRAVNIDNVSPSEPVECPNLPPSMVVIPGLGSCTFKPPKPGTLIVTSQWGEVPADQILVVAKEGCSRCVAMDLADSLNGSVVGYIDFIDLYQIETQGDNEADLRRALFRAESSPYIKAAFPHQKVFPERSPLEDPVYSNDRDLSYRIVGVQEAWDVIRSSGLSLASTKIGVVDDGLYKGYGEFDGVVHIDTSCNGSLLQRPSAEYRVAGSHGTGIMNLIAADPDNGGLVGIASEPLRANLTVAMVNMLSPIYSQTGDAWYMGYMMALCMAGMGSNLLSISWGNSECDPDAVIKSGDFFKEWANAYPDRLFVCSAGNDGKAIDGSRRFPYTYNLTNVITVGCINNDGTLNAKSCRISNNFEVTLAVPGDQAVWGRDDKGALQDSGGETSMSVPFVTATAALVRSLDPSLNASSIKSLLTQTARTSIDVQGVSVPAPEEVGGGVLAIDLAVQKVIADRRNSTGAMG